MMVYTTYIKDTRPISSGKDPLPTITSQQPHTLQLKRRATKNNDETRRTHHALCFPSHPAKQIQRTLILLDSQLNQE